MHTKDFNHAGTWLVPVNVHPSAPGLNCGTCLLIGLLSTRLPPPSNQGNLDTQVRHRRGLFASRLDSTGSLFSTGVWVCSGTRAPTMDCLGTPWTRIKGLPLLSPEQLGSFGAMCPALRSWDSHTSQIGWDYLIAQKDFSHQERFPYRFL